MILMLTNLGQTFAQLEEARRKKSLASRRKQSHYQVRLSLGRNSSSVLQYQILGVDRRAPIEGIKKAYRAKVIPIAPS